MGIGKEITELQDKIGYKFADLKFLETAVTHSHTEIVSHHFHLFFIYNLIIQPQIKKCEDTDCPKKQKHPTIKAGC